MMRQAGGFGAAREIDDRPTEPLHGCPEAHDVRAAGRRLVGPRADEAVDWAERRRIAEQGRGGRAWSLCGPL